MDCRIVSVSSMAHSGGSLDLSNIQAQKNFSTPKFYSNSKLFQVINEIFKNTNAQNPSLEMNVKSTIQSST